MSVMVDQVYYCNCDGFLQVQTAVANQDSDSGHRHLEAERNTLPIAGSLTLAVRF